MKFPWSSGKPQGAGPTGETPAAGGPKPQGHGLVGSAEEGVREVLLLSVSMVLVLFNLLGQRRGSGSSN